MAFGRIGTGLHNNTKEIGQSEELMEKLIKNLKKKSAQMLGSRV